MKKCLIFPSIFFLFLLFAASGCSSNSEPKLHIIVEGNVVNSGIEVFFLEEGNIETAMYPYKEFLKALNVTDVNYHEKSHSLEIRHRDTYIFLTEDNPPLVNTQILEIAANPVMKDGQFCIPVKFVAETLGYRVTWSEEEKRIEMTKNNN